MPHAGRIRVIVAAMLLAAVRPVTAAPAAGVPMIADEVGGYASTHVVIRARPGVAITAPGSRAFAAAMQDWHVSAITPVFEGFAHPELARQLGLDRYYRLATPPGTDTPALTAELRRFAGLVESVELDGVGTTAAIPNDPDFDLQWGMLNNGDPGLAGADINITPGWDITTGHPGLVLAVLDAGMDPHIELLDRLIPGINVAADPDNGDTSDVCISHGTHVAGIAAAGADNEQGVAGVDWQCRIMPVRVLNGCTGLESHLAEGIVWAADNGADVINMSLQFSTGSAVLHDAVLYAHGLDVAMIAASGNSSLQEVSFPARWPETIAVGAIDSNGDRWGNSNRGPNLDVMAPGVSVWSLNNTAQYQFLTGTSMATPHVAGVVTLLRALAPWLTPDELRQILRHTAVDMQLPGFDEATGYGRVDAFAALTEAFANPADLDGDGTVGITDFLLLLEAWGPCPGAPDPCPADLDGDGTVGITDFLDLLANWG